MRSTSSTLNRLPTADAAEYRVARPKVGIAVYNEPYFWNPIDNGTYSAKSNNRIRIDIPSSDIWDFRHGWFAADVTITSDGVSQNELPPYLRMAAGTWNLFERLRHLSNLSPFEEMYPYWSLYSWQWIFEQSETIEQTFREQLGVGTQNERNSWAMNTGGTPATGGVAKRFIFPIDLGWLTSGPFPAKMINTTQSIEVFLADPNQCIESNCGNLNFSLSNVELHAYKLTNKFPGCINDYRGTSWEEGFCSFIKSGQYEVMLDYFDWYQNTNLTQQGSYLVPVKTAAIQGIYTVFGNVQDISNPKVNDKALTFPKHALSQFQYKIFAKTYPEQPVDCRNEAFQAYQFYCNLVNAWRLNAFPATDPSSPDAINEAPIKLKEFNEDAFCAVVDFRSIRKVASINPIFNSDIHTGEIRVILRFDGAPPEGTCTYHIVRSSSIFGISPDGTPWTALN